MFVLLLGLPGVGKGAIARKLKNNLKFDIFSTGELFREEIRKETELGLMVKANVSTGKPVSDDLILSLVKERLEKKGDVILEGFPKNIAQAEALDAYFTENGMQLDVVLHFDAPEEILKERIRQRRICTHCSAVYHLQNCPPKVENVCNHCGSPLSKRADDEEDFLIARLERYISNVEPILEYYRDQGILTEIDASQPLMEVYYDVIGSSVKFTMGSFR